VTPRILIIAGSDSGGGAGIQADIKTVTMLGGHAMTAITAITAQNTLGVQGVMPVPAEMVVAQIVSCVSDIGVDAIKIGMIGSPETAHAVADAIESLDVPIVFDPVMVATSGSLLADADTIAAFERLMRLATLVTPNLPELVALCSAYAPARAETPRSLAERGDNILPFPVRAEPVEAPSPAHPDETPASPPVRPELVEGRAANAPPATRASTSSARTDGKAETLARTGDAAKALARATGATILSKGGHADGNRIVDRLVGPEGEIARWEGKRIDTLHNHGTGCTLASAIATGLGGGRALEDSVARGIRFVRIALLSAPGLGQGHGPMGHSFGTIPFDEIEG